jgi:UDP-glucose 4-epimerase
MSANEPFSKIPVVISGGAGFIGFHLSTRLLSLGTPVTILTRRVQTPKAVELAKQGARFVVCDVASPKGIPSTEQCGPAQVFIHLAADVTVNGQGLQETNVGGTARILELANKLHIPYFVLASSIEAQGLGTNDEIPLKETAPCRPESEYGVSKARAEELVLQWGSGEGKQSLILRVGNVYGPGSAWLFQPTLLALLGVSPLGPAWAHLRHRVFQPLYIDDLIEGMIRALTLRLTGLYNITGEEPVTIHQHFQTLADLTGLSDRFANLTSTAPAGVSPTGIAADFAYMLMGTPERCHRSYDNSKLREEIGPYARWPLARGLASTLHWYHGSGMLRPLIETIRARHGTTVCASH